ncbi:MAG TPA: hypothetical protein VFV82_09625, partial [Candidatus Binatia bacterium]|nr:hypothetical protein [Candidatus Binatia bacterium]
MHAETVEAFRSIFQFPLDMTLANDFALCFHGEVIPLMRALPVFAILLSEPLWAASDPLEEVLQENSSKARQEEKIKELQRREQLEKLRRDRESQHYQQHLEQLRRRPAEPSRPESQSQQQRLDQQRNDQQLEHLQTERKLEQIRREQDRLR